MPYVHVVFTLPHALLPLAYRNSTRLYTWLFQASAATLRDVAADPRDLVAEIGVLSILHTWGRHSSGIPTVVPAGGLSPDHPRWIHPKYAGFFLPVTVLSRVFRGKFVESLRRAYDRKELDLAGGTEHLRDRSAWRAFVGPLFETDLGRLRQARLRRRLRSNLRRNDCGAVTYVAKLSSFRSS